MVKALKYKPKVLKKAIFVAHNPGIGDQIILQGAVRYLATKYDKVFYFTWDNLDQGTSRVEHAKFIFKDDNNIEVYTDDDIEYDTPFNFVDIEKNFKRITLENRDYFFPPYKRQFYARKIENVARDILKLDNWDNIIFPRIFYKLMDVPYETRYTFKKIPRDKEKEQEVFDRLNIREPYAFCVNRGSGMQWNFDYKTNLRIINPAENDFWKETLLYHWQLVIERASEIHTVDTGWLHLIRSLQLNVPKYFYSVKKFILADVNSKGEYLDEFLNDSGDSNWQKIDPQYTTVCL